jgi:environmental stress-induced protein Ves
MHVKFDDVALTHLTAADYARQPWKNRGGTTTEIAREDARGRLSWRVSIADVERSGPFSDFAGYRRIIMLLEGRGMALSFDRAPPMVLEHPYQPFAFDGAWRTDCRLLDGAVRDLNLIFDEAHVAASIDVRMASDAASFKTRVDDCALLHAIDGAFRIDVADGSVTTEAGDTLRVDCTCGVVLSCTALDPHAVLALMRFAQRR